MASAAAAGEASEGAAAVEAVLQASSRCPTRKEDPWVERQARARVVTRGATSEESV